MEGMRGVAVLLVFLIHYVSQILPWAGPDSVLQANAYLLSKIGSSGVDLFFVLSGFLIYGTLIDRTQPFAPYMRRRIERIYPTFIFVFLVYLLLDSLRPDGSQLPADLGDRTVLIVQNLLLLPGMFEIEALVEVAWSLSYEMFYYLALPLLIVVARLRSLSALQRLGIFVGIAFGIFLWGALYNGMVRLAMFVAGIIVYECLRVAREAAPSNAVALLACFAAIGATGIQTWGSVPGSLKVVGLFVAFGTLCYSCFARPTGWLARALSWTPLRWLGNMSYSYYLVHGLTLSIGFHLLAVVVPPMPSGDWVFWALLLPALAATLISSAAVFLAIERPFSLDVRARRTGVRVNATT
jgi:peptidoglycan/LPS O-acetylase OafA/YrhL